MNTKLLNDLKNGDFKKSLSLTNNIWNKEGFNSQHNIGAVMGILKKYQNEINCLEDFKAKYYESGLKRENYIKEKLDSELQILNDPNHMMHFNQNNRALHKLNYELGRSKEYIQKVSEIFAKKANISEEEAFKQVEYRIFNETYMGENFENLLLEKLQKLTNEFEINKANKDIDSKYAVDLVVTKEEKIVYGVQVKPVSYFSKTGENQHELNAFKNKKFEEDYNAKVYYAGYLKSDNYPGFIVNHKFEKMLKGEA